MQTIVHHGDIWERMANPDEFVIMPPRCDNVRRYDPHTDTFYALNRRQAAKHITKQHRWLALQYVKSLNEMTLIVIFSVDGKIVGCVPTTDVIQAISHANFDYSTGTLKYIPSDK
jgi:hypothetical protein